MTARTTALPTVLAMVVGLAACGGSQGGQPSQQNGGRSPSPASATRPVATIDVRETEFAIKPRDVRIPRPGTVRFRVENAGQAPHALAIEGPNGEAKTGVLQAGDSGTLTADLSAPGKYKWYCPVGEHEQEGMKGTLTVG